MPANFPERKARLSWVSAKTLHFLILCVVAVVIVLLTFTSPALAIDLKAASYVNLASAPVTMEPLAAVSREVTLATGIPSQILLIGKDKMAIRYRLPLHFSARKAVKHTGVTGISIVDKADRESYIPAASSNPRILRMLLD